MGIPTIINCVIYVTCIATFYTSRRERLVSFFYKVYIEIIKLNNKYINVLDDMVMYCYIHIGG